MAAAAAAALPSSASALALDAVELGSWTPCQWLATLEDGAGKKSLLQILADALAAGGDNKKQLDVLCDIADEHEFHELVATAS